MKHRKLIVIACVSLLLVVALGGLALQFDVTRKVLNQIVSAYPFSSIVNRIQRHTIPSNNAQCLIELAKQNVSFKAQSSFSNDKGCSVQHAVRLSRVGNVKLDNAPLLTCRMATQLAKFEVDYLQPTAQNILGSKIKRIKHIGTYSCRSMRQYGNVLSHRCISLRYGRRQNNQRRERLERQTGEVEVPEEGFKISLQVFSGIRVSRC